MAAMIGIDRQPAAIVDVAGNVIARRQQVAAAPGPERARLHQFDQRAGAGEAADGDAAEGLLRPLAGMAGLDPEGLVLIGEGRIEGRRDDSAAGSPPAGPCVEIVTLDEVVAAVRRHAAEQHREAVHGRTPGVRRKMDG